MKLNSPGLKGIDEKNKANGLDPNVAIYEGKKPGIDFKIGHRPHKLTPRVRKIILDCIVAGNYLYTAMEAAGVTYQTYMGWLQQGKDGVPPFSSFLVDVKKAMADAEIKLVKTIDAAALKEWTAAAWLLERTRPEKFGKRDNVTINDGKGLDVNVHEELKISIINKIEAVAGRQVIEVANADDAIRSEEHNSEDSRDAREPETGILQITD